MEQVQVQKVTKAQTRVICLLGAACVAAIAVIVFLLIRTGRASTAEVNRKNFTPPAFESAAVRGTPEPEAALGWSELTVREHYVVHACGNLIAGEDGRVAVWLYNEPKNDVWVKLRLTAEDGSVLGQTGVLRPGEYVEYLQLDAVPEQTTPVTLYVIGYEPDTYYSAGNLALNTQLQVGGQVVILD